MRFFAPRGRHVAPMGVKFGMEEGTCGPLLRTKFHPHRCNDKGVGPPKLKFLLRFDQNLEYKAPRCRGVSLAILSQVDFWSSGEMTDFNGMEVTRNEREIYSVADCRNKDR